MHRSVILLALALVAAPSAYAADFGPCLQCERYGAQPVKIDGQNCPICVRPSNYNCPGITGAAVCCGGDTYIPCPTIACATSVSTAISGTGGCAIATSKMTAVAKSQSQVTFNFPDTIYKPILEEYCSAQDVTDFAIEKYVDELSSAYAKAFTKAVAGWSAFVCTCVGCPRCPSAAYTALSANVASFAQAQAASVISAVMETTGCGDGWPIAAGADAQAFAEDTQAALLSVLVSARAWNGGCSKYFTDVEFENKVAQALACAWVKVLINARYTLSSNTWDYTAVACSNTLAMTGPLVALNKSCPIKYCLEPKH